MTEQDQSIFIKDVYEPLEQYERIFKEKFKEISSDTFKELADAANVNIEENKKICSEINELEFQIKNLAKKLKSKRILCTILWIITILSFFLTFTLIPIIVIAILCGIILFTKIHPKIKELKNGEKELEHKKDAKKDIAWEQMHPLNKLYDWDILTRIMTKTIPRLEFDPYVTTQRISELKKNYEWDDYDNENRSILCSHSGSINGNPFIICRTRSMIWGEKTYYGSKTIHWTTREHDANGKMIIRHHSQTLRAEYSAPYPKYYEGTRLIYGNSAAPDLTFSREKSNLATREGSLRYKYTHLKQKRKSNNMRNDYVMLNNDKFEVAFDTSNRNNEQQYRLLFTPLAQQNILKILQDKEIGYGDDFDFYKKRKINTIISDHIQSIDLEMNPNIYKDYCFESAKYNFMRINAEYFRAIYFCFAPLLSIPLYQQTRPHNAIYHKENLKSSFWEHEVWANYWGDDNFKDKRCVTKCILKTSQQLLNDTSSKIQVDAYGYRNVRHIARIPKLGGDGRWHNVSVEWYEYCPVVGHGSFTIREDSTDYSNLKVLDRHEKINNIQGNDIFRRHIISSNPIK